MRVRKRVGAKEGISNEKEHALLIRTCGMVAGRKIDVTVIQSKTERM